MSIIVTVNDMRAAGFCARVPREWFKRPKQVELGLSWKDFLDKKITVEQLRATGDVLAIKVAEVAEKREAASRE